MSPTPRGGRPSATTLALKKRSRLPGAKNRLRERIDTKTYNPIPPEGLTTYVAKDPRKTRRALNKIRKTREARLAFLKGMSEKTYKKLIASIRERAEFDNVEEIQAIANAIN